MIININEDKIDLKGVIDEVLNISKPIKAEIFKRLNNNKIIKDKDDLLNILNRFCNCRDKELIESILIDPDYENFLYIITTINTCNHRNKYNFTQWYEKKQFSFTELTICFLINPFALARTSYSQWQKDLVAFHHFYCKYSKIFLKICKFADFQKGFYGSGSTYADFQTPLLNWIVGIDLSITPFKFETNKEKDPFKQINYFLNTTMEYKITNITEQCLDAVISFMLDLKENKPQGTENK